MNRIIFLILMFSHLCILFAQSNNNYLLSFYPLEIGDKWIYEGKQINDGSLMSKNTVQFIVQNDTLMPNQKYYKSIIHLNDNKYFETIYERIDTSGMNVYAYNKSFQDEEYLKFDLKQEVGDTIETPFWNIWLSEENNFDYFGESYSGKKYFKMKNGESGCMIYLQNIGRIRDAESDCLGMCYHTLDLKGAIINNIVYGDTTFVVSVNKENNTLVNKFFLSQNYPNPFNPTTTISYTIPSRSFVQLKVYNALGNVVANLVNKEEPRGNYNIEFNASKLASGIYFYRLQSGNFSKTKKFVLLK